jgi:hypothetical protein
MTSIALPTQFAHLARFADWALDSERARNRKRLASTMTDIREFYDAMLACVDDALEYLNGFPLQDMPAPERNLLNLTLSLAEVANAVELFKTQPGVIDGFDMERFYLIHEGEAVPAR